MSAYLAELMADAELYGWEATKAFHAVWLQQLEQGQVTWRDTQLRVSYCHTFMWHRPAKGSKQASAAAGKLKYQPLKCGGKTGDEGVPNL